jgi:hypothetical protein
LVCVSKEETCETKASVAAEGSCDLRGIKYEGWDTIVAVTMELHRTELGTEFEGMAAANPREVVAIDKSVGGNWARKYAESMASRKIYVTASLVTFWGALLAGRAAAAILLRYTSESSLFRGAVTLIFFVVREGRLSRI